MERGLDSSDDEDVWVQFIATKTRSAKIFQERKNPFDDFNECEFKERFRLNKSTTLLLLKEIEDKLEYTSDRNKSVSPMNQLLITLRFFATGTFHLVVGDLFGVNKSTCCRLMKKVIPLIAGLSRKYIRIPETLEERKAVMVAFHANSGMPGVIGAIDCTHVPIISPEKNLAEAYRNRKGYYSLNVQLICKPDLTVVDVVARWPGSSHDSTIFDFSSVRAKFENNEITDCYLIGDSGYACRPYLLTPVPEPVRSTNKRDYNASHVQARNCIERTNGVIKQRFPGLKYGLRMKTEHVPALIVAVVVLHNIATLVENSDPPLDKELQSYIEEKERAGIRTEFEDFDIEPPSTQGFTGATRQRSALIESHF